MGTPAVGALAKLGMAATGTAIGSYTECYEFLSESLAAKRTILDLSGIRGTRSHPAERCRVGTYTVGGTIEFNPVPTELDNLLPRILGASESSDVFAVAETLPDFDVAIDRVTKVFTYGGCKIVKATFSGSSGSPLKLAIDLVGKTEAIGNAGTFAAITPSLTAPYVVMDGVLTLLSSTRQFKDFELTIENAAETDRFLNSTTVTDIPIIDRKVTLKATVPYTSDEVDLYNQALTGGAATIVFTNGNVSTSFALANVKATEGNSPVINGRGELMLQLNLTAYTSSTTKEIIVTSDSTP